MKTEELVIDCDGHILEPPDLWEKYIDPKYRDRAMRIRVGDDGFVFIVGNTIAQMVILKGSELLTVNVQGDPALQNITLPTLTTLGTAAAARL